MAPIQTFYKRRESEFLIFLSAIAIRLIYLLEFQNSPFSSYLPKSTDAYQYETGAIEITQGNFLATSFYNSFSPFYKYFLAIIYTVFGRSLLAVYLIQFVIGSFAAVLIFQIGEKAFSRPVGILAACFFIFFGPEIMSEALLLREFLITFTALLSLRLLISISQRLTLENSWHLVFRFLV